MSPRNLLVLLKDGPDHSGMVRPVVAIEAQAQEPPLTAKLVGELSLLVQVPWNPIWMEPLAAMVPL